LRRMPLDLLGVKLSCCIVALILLSGTSSTPTTPYIEQVFLGRCYLKSPYADCLGLWQSFTKGATVYPAFAKNSDWDPFFKTANFSSGVNGALFWSGNGDLADSLAEATSTFVNLEETNTGKVLNGLVWCGNSSNQFDFHNECSYNANNTYYGMEPVWQRASQMYAQNARGTAHVLLQPKVFNGAWTAYRSNSVFKTIELPNLKEGQVTEVQLFLVRNRDAPTEHCWSGSLLDFAFDVYQKFGFFPKCEDNYNVLSQIFCKGNFNSALCTAVQIGAGDCCVSLTSKSISLDLSARNRDEITAVLI